jgi:hypothetical protein
MTKQNLTRLTIPTPTTWTEIVQHGNATTHAAGGNALSIQRQGHREAEYIQGTQTTQSKGQNNGARDKQETNITKETQRREDPTLTSGMEK